MPEPSNPHENSPATSDRARVLIRPRCPCGRGVHTALASTPCPSCGQTDWREKHEPAFEQIVRRPDGWYGRQTYYHLDEWDGPFATSELAASVRYDHVPGYLVCGLCGSDDVAERLVEHCRREHADGVRIARTSACPSR
jgi:hypothetical protein